MSDTEPTIDFEEPPPIARRSEHLPLLLALKDHPGKSARIQKDRQLTAAEAQQLAGVIQRAAAKIGDGYDVVTRFIPAADHHGVWVTYQPAAGDEPEPNVPTAEARAAARADIEEAMTPQYRKDAIRVESAELTGDGSGEALPPVEDDSDWELPERTGVGA